MLATTTYTVGSSMAIRYHDSHRYFKANVAANTAVRYKRSVTPTSVSREEKLTSGVVGPQVALISEDTRYISLGCEERGKWAR